MINKQIRHSFTGMNQDISKSKFPEKFYFEGGNIRILATNSQSSYAVTNEQGNTKKLDIPIPAITSSTTIEYGTSTLNFTTTEIDDNYLISPGVYKTSGVQKIIGAEPIRDFIILFTTDDEGFDCIWKVNDTTYEITLLYMRNLNFSINNPIYALNNYENENIDKIYWVDGKSQLRYFNTQHSIENGDLEESIDIPSTTINQVGTFQISQPEVIEVLAGGAHTSGMIQYAYNLYRLNSSQTKISTFSEILSLDKDLGGGAINETVSSLPVVRISDIDPNYTHIKVYAIKYTSLNQIPSISLIEDREVPPSRRVDVFDDGSTIASLSIEELTFLGSDIIVPKHIQSKNSRLFLANYEEINFDVDLDTRAYSFTSDIECTIYTDVFLDETNVIQGTPFEVNSVTFAAPPKFDSINLDYNTFKYQSDGVTLGGEGQYLKYKLVSDAGFDENDRYFKDNEIYRIAIQFYNIYGQISQPKWIADFRAPEGNLNQLYNKLSVTLKPDFYTWLNTPANFPREFDKPTGYKILVAERTFNDRTILASGILNGMMFNNKSTEELQGGVDYLRSKGSSTPKMPDILQRNLRSDSSNYSKLTAPLKKSANFQQMLALGGTYNNPANELSNGLTGQPDTAGRCYQFTNMLQMYSPEVLFGSPIVLTNDCKLKTKALLRNKNNFSWTREIDLETNNVDTEAKTTNGLSVHYSSYQTIAGPQALALQDFAAFIAHPGGANPNRTERNSFYRSYGNIEAVNAGSNLGTLITYTQPITELSQSGGISTRASFITGNKGFTVAFNSQVNQVDVTISIPSQSPFETYDIFITNDEEGSNILTQALNVNTTTLALTYSYVAASPTEIVNFYVFVKNKSFSSLSFPMTVDIVMTHSSNPDFVNYQILNQSVSISLPEPPTASTYYIPTPDLRYDILGAPEVTEKGQTFTTYNNNPTYRYTNSLVSLLTDGDSTWADDGTYSRKIISANIDSAKCITMVPFDSTKTNYWEHPTLESIFEDTGIVANDYVLLGELVKSDEDIYGNGLYGGNSWEDKHRTDYLEIGNYSKINIDTINISSPGDTYVANFKFLRLSKREVAINNQGVKEYQEIVEYPVETTINLRNRNDDSLQVWDAAFSYDYNEYHKYNNVYSQQPNLIRRRGFDFNFKATSFFDTTVTATNPKIPGELIDSWTDILVNEKLLLDGKYGPVNNLVSFKDNLYTLQDRALAYLSIEPRVQVQGSDGINIQLGTGQLFDSYEYIATDTGTLNKASVVVSPQGIYYYDNHNKSFNVFKGGVQGLSDVKGMHTYFLNNVSFNDIKFNNPLLKFGITSCYDYLNNEVLMTFLQSEQESFTIAYNEVMDTFTSLYSYLPSIYISKGNYLITSNSLTNLYKHFEGLYNMFYDTVHPSYIIFLSNPEADLDTVFDNISYKNEFYNAFNMFLPNKTFDEIQLWHENQITNDTPIVIGRTGNARNKFKEWNIQLPREFNSRNRMRNPWMFIKLKLNGTEGDKMILHDPIISYSI